MSPAEMIVFGRVLVTILLLGFVVFFALWAYAMKRSFGGIFSTRALFVLLLINNL